MVFGKKKKEKKMGMPFMMDLRPPRQFEEARNIPKMIPKDKRI